LNLWCCEALLSCVFLGSNMQNRQTSGRGIPRRSPHAWCALRWGVLVSFCTCVDLLPRAPAIGRGPSPRQTVDDLQSVEGQIDGTRSKLRPPGSVCSVLEVLRSHSAEIRSSRTLAPLGHASCGLRGLRGGSSGAGQEHGAGGGSREDPGVAEPWRGLQGAADERRDPDAAVAPGGIPSHLKLTEPFSAFQQPLEAAPTHRPPGSNLGGHMRPGQPDRYGANPPGPFSQPGQYPQEHPPPFRPQPGFQRSAANSNIGGYGGGGAYPNAAVPWRDAAPGPSYPSWQRPVVPAPPASSVKSMHVTVPEGVAAGMHMTVNIPGRGPTSVLVCCPTLAVC